MTRAFTNITPAGTIVYQVTQCQCQGQYLDEAKRDLDALKKAQYKAECDMRHLEERFEREMGSANNEIRYLRVRLPPYHIPFVNDGGCLCFSVFEPGNRGSREASGESADPLCSARRYPAVCCGNGGHQNRLTSFTLRSLERTG